MTQKVIRTKSLGFSVRNVKMKSNNTKRKRRVVRKKKRKYDF